MKVATLLVCVLLAAVFVAAEPRFRDGARVAGSEKADSSSGDLNDFIQETINNNKVVVFSKSYCPLVTFPFYCNDPDWLTWIIDTAKEQRVY